MAHEGQYLALAGSVDNRDHEIERLTAEVERLEEELALARQSSSRERAAILQLRNQLGPLFRALQAVFGIVDATGIPDSSPTTAMANHAGLSAREVAVWDSWKQKLGGKAATFIEVLLEHGEMNSAQLRVAAKCASQTVYDTIHKLNSLGLITKNGGRFALKRLT